MTLEEEWEQNIQQILFEEYSYGNHMGTNNISTIYFNQSIKIDYF